MASAIGYKQTTETETGEQDTLYINEVWGTLPVLIGNVLRANAWTPIPEKNRQGKLYRTVRTDVYETDSDNIDYTCTQETGVSLLMPQYARRVEVEDLDKNFWVIGNLLDSVVNALWGEKSLVKTVEALIDELNDVKNMIGGTTVVSVDMRIGDNDTKNVFSTIDLQNMYVVLKTDSSSREFKVPISHYSSTTSSNALRGVFTSWSEVCAYHREHPTVAIFDADFFFDSNNTQIDPNNKKTDANGNETEIKCCSLRQYLNYIMTNDIGVADLLDTNNYTLPNTAYVVLFGKGQYQIDKENNTCLKMIKYDSDGNELAWTRYRFNSNTLFLQVNDLYNYELVSFSLGTNNRYLDLSNSIKKSYYDHQQSNVIHDINTEPLDTQYKTMFLQNNFGASNYLGDLYTYSAVPNIFIKDTNSPALTDGTDSEVKRVIPLTYFIPELNNYTNNVTSVQLYQPDITICKFDVDDFTYEPKTLQHIQLLTDTTITNPLLVNEYSLSGVNGQCDLFAGQGYLENNKCTQTFANLFTNSSNAVTANDISPRINPSDSTIVQEIDSLRKFSLDYNKFYSDVVNYTPTAPATKSLFHDALYGELYGTILWQLINKYNTTIRKLTNNQTSNLLETLMGSITYYYRNIICCSFVRDRARRTAKPINLDKMQFRGTVGSHAYRNATHYMIFGIRRHDQVYETDDYIKDNIGEPKKNEINALFPGRIELIDVGKTGLTISNSSDNATLHTVKLFQIYQANTKGCFDSDSYVGFNGTHLSNYTYYHGTKEQALGGRKNFIGYIILLWSQDGDSIEHTNEEKEGQTLCQIRNFALYGSTAPGYVIY